jgi:hypothetical protein
MGDLQDALRAVAQKDVVATVRSGRYGSGVACQTPALPWWAHHPYPPVVSPRAYGHAMARDNEEKTQSH